MKKNIKKLLSYRFTFMLVPHGSSHPRQMNIRLSVVLFVLLGWTGLTFWSSYLSARHVDYWYTQLSNQVLKMKVKFLVSELNQSQGFLDEVKKVDFQLRQLLQYQNGASIITDDRPLQHTAEGGPSLIDQINLTSILKTTDNDLSWQNLVEKVVSVKNEARGQITSFHRIASWIDNQRHFHRSIPQGWPCPGRITSHFGKRVSPFSEEREENHLGVDISGKRGNPIQATADGIVKLSSWHSGYGNLIVIEHDFGFSTRYAHNSRLLVEVGDRIKRGQVVSLMGDTGKASGYHCHYEVWRNNQPKNPFSYLQEESPELAFLNKLAKTHKPAVK